MFIFWPTNILFSLRSFLWSSLSLLHIHAHAYLFFVCLNSSRLIKSNERENSHDAKMKRIQKENCQVLWCNKQIHTHTHTAQQPNLPLLTSRRDQQNRLSQHYHLQTGLKSTFDQFFLFVVSIQLKTNRRISNSCSKNFSFFSIDVIRILTDR